MSKVDKIKRLFQGLSDDDKNELIDDLMKEQEEGTETPAPETETEEQVETAEENVAEDGETSEQTDEDRVDESVGEQEAEDGNEDSESTDVRVDESEGEAEAAKPDGTEARLTELEKRISELEKSKSTESSEADEATKRELSAIESIYND